MLMRRGLKTITNTSRVEGALSSLSSLAFVAIDVSSFNFEPETNQKLHVYIYILICSSTRLPLLKILQLPVVIVFVTVPGVLPISLPHIPVPGLDRQHFKDIDFVACPGDKYYSWYDTLHYTATLTRGRWYTTIPRCFTKLLCRMLRTFAVSMCKPIGKPHQIGTISGV